MKCGKEQVSPDQVTASLSRRTNKGTGTTEEKLKAAVGI